MNWKPFSSYGNVFVEITKASNKHDAAGWRLGECLWSPARNRAGSDRYSIMRLPTTNDLVLHFYATSWSGEYESRLAGHSLVAAATETIDEEPPSAGAWTGFDAYYRVPLKDYEPFETPLSLRRLLSDYGEEIRGDLKSNKARFYPFTTHGSEMRPQQGIYLAQATAGLYAILGRALGIEEASRGSNDGHDPHREYAEARRLSRERYYFARNPGLIAEAKQHHGLTCQACGFDFRAHYGELGNGYIECHHLNPLSERPEEEQLIGTTTSIDDVAVVCANCHRMLHRRRPALSLQELKEQLQVPSF